MPTPPGFASCSYEIRHSLMSRSAFLTFGIDPTGTDPNLVATQVRQAFGVTGSLYSALDANATLVSTRVSLGTDGSEDIVGLDAVQVPCTKTLSACPPNCAILVHKRTSRGGRRGRGRMYIPFAANATTTTEQGNLAATNINEINAAVQVWLTALSTTPGPLVLLHRPSQPGVANPTTPGPPNPVTSMTVDTLIATQRRRLGR